MSFQVVLSGKSKNFDKKSDPNQSEPNQSEPNQSKLNQSKPNQSKPNQSEPNQSNWNFLKSPRAPWSYFFISVHRQWNVSRISGTVQQCGWFTNSSSVWARWNDRCVWLCSNNRYSRTFRALTIWGSDCGRQSSLPHTTLCEMCWTANFQII